MDECAQVLELWKSAEAIPRPTDTLPDLQRIVREHPDTLLVGEEDGRLIGTVIAGWDGWRGGIYRLAVLPGCRRRALAHALRAGGGWGVPGEGGGLLYRGGGEADEGVAEGVDLAADFGLTAAVGSSAITPRRRAALAVNAALAVAAVQDHVDVGLGGELAREIPVEVQLLTGHDEEVVAHDFF